MYDLGFWCSKDLKGSSQTQQVFKHFLIEYIWFNMIKLVRLDHSATTFFSFFTFMNNKHIHFIKCFGFNNNELALITDFCTSKWVLTHILLCSISGLCIYTLNVRRKYITVFKETYGPYLMLWMEHLPN